MRHLQKCDIAVFNFLASLILIQVIQVYVSFTIEPFKFLCFSKKKTKKKRYH